MTSSSDSTTYPFNFEELGLNLDDMSEQGWKPGQPPFPFVATITGQRGYSPVKLTMYQGMHSYFADQDSRNTGSLIQIAFDHHPSDGGSIWYEASVEVEADFAFGLGPKFKLLREGTFRSWLKQYGYQDIELGNASVDFELTIKGKPVDQIKDVLLSSIDVLERYVVKRLGTLPVSDTVQVKASISVSTTNRERSIKSIRDLVDLVGGIASCDLVGLKTLRELPDNRERLEDDMPVVSIHMPTQVDFCPKVSNKRFVSRARTALTSETRPGKLSCGDVEKVEEFLGLHGIGRLLDEIGDAQLLVDKNHAQIVWPGIVTNTSILLAAAKLLVRIATPSGGGAYR